VLTPTHLAIVMEYAAGGELFERICNAGRFSEDEVKNIFHKVLGTFVVRLYVTILTDYYLRSTGKVLLPTTDFRSELLSFHGTNPVKLITT